MPGTSGPLVVLVEEDTRQRADIAAHLRSEGFTIAEASDGPGALDLLERRPEAAALVADAHPAGRMTGAEIGRLARERRPGLAVILVSGRSDDASGPIPPGAAFVAKPYLLEQLAPSLRRMIAGAA